MKTLQTAVDYWTPTTTNANSLAELDARSYELPLDTVEWGKLLRNQRVVAVAAGLRRSPLAYGVIESVGKGTFKLRRLAVDADYRRLGIGRDLVGLICGNWNVHLKLRETNLTGLKFAVAVGFRVKRLEVNGFVDCDAIHLLRSSTERLTTSGHNRT